MSNSLNVIKYVKHNKVRIKADSKREEITNIFEEIKGKSTGMKGFMVMDDLQDLQESIVLTFWERKDDMDSFYESNIMNE